MAKCEIVECARIAVSHGLCAMHRLRFARHGTANAGRPQGWGEGRTHPLYMRWLSMRRTSRRSGGHNPLWDNFWAFVADVSPQPSKVHRLYRIDDDKPFGPGNFYWREPVGLSQSGREAKNAYMREWHKQRPHKSKSLYLKRHYGMTIDQYEELFRKQHGKCAICGCEETAVGKDGKAFMLAVDHDHETGKIRGLLCMAHNRGLGLFNDDATVLRAAIAYLERHAVSPLDIGPATG